MKNWLKKTIQGVTVAAAVSVPVGMSLYQEDEPQPLFPQTEILGQEEAVVGELVRLQAHGADVDWKILPVVHDYQVFGENNQNLVASFRKNGTYTVVAAILTDDVEIKIETLEIKIADKVVVPEKPEKPTQPDPEPEIKPELNEVVVAQVEKWSKQSELPASLANDLADKFNLVASEIDSGRIVTAEGVIARTTQLLSTLNLSPYEGLIGNLQDLMAEQADQGALLTQPDHALLWRSIAKGLSSSVSVDLAVYRKAQ